MLPNSSEFDLTLSTSNMGTKIARWLTITIVNKANSFVEVLEILQNDDKHNRVRMVYELIV